MPTKITITCDMPEDLRSVSPEFPEIRCYSSVNDNVIGVYENLKIPKVERAFLALRQTATFQGWGWQHFGRVNRFICPGCKRKYGR